MIKPTYDIFHKTECMYIETKLEKNCFKSLNMVPAIIIILQKYAFQ